MVITKFCCKTFLTSSFSENIKTIKLLQTNNYMGCKIFKQCLLVVVIILIQNRVLNLKARSHIILKLSVHRNQEKYENESMTEKGK